jgi:hypothetical protein
MARQLLVNGAATSSEPEKNVPPADTHEDTSPHAEQPISRGDPTIRDPAPLFADENDLESSDELGFDRPLFLESPAPEEVTSVSSPELYQSLIDSSRMPETKREEMPESPMQQRNSGSPGAPRRGARNLNSPAPSAARPRPLPALPIESLYPSSPLDEEDLTPTIPATPSGLELELFSDLSPSLPPPPPPPLPTSPTAAIQRSSAYQVPAVARPAAPSTHHRATISWLPLLLGILLPLLAILIILAIGYL